MVRSPVLFMLVLLVVTPPARTLAAPAAPGRATSAADVSIAEVAPPAVPTKGLPEEVTLVAAGGVLLLLARAVRRTTLLR